MIEPFDEEEWNIIDSIDYSDCELCNIDEVDCDNCIKNTGEQQ